MLALADGLASWGWDGAIRFWSLTGEPRSGGDPSAHEGGVLGVLALADGLVSWGHDNAIRFWNLAGEPRPGGDSSAHEGGVRGVLALEDEAKVDQLHACGGNARCTTCRVEFVAGEPDTMTEAEKAVLAAKGETGGRLSCQIVCDDDMAVKCISRLAGSGRVDAGKRPADVVAPPPVWTTKG